MSETPTNPYAAPAATYASMSTEHTIGNPEFWMSPERQTAQESGAEFNLNEDEPYADSLWTAEELAEPVKAIERLESVETNHVRQTEMAYHSLTDAELLDRFAALTRAVGIMANSR